MFDIPGTSVLQEFAIGNFEEFSTVYYLGHLMAKGKLKTYSHIIQYHTICVDEQRHNRYFSNKNWVIRNL